MRVIRYLQDLISELQAPVQAGGCSSRHHLPPASASPVTTAGHMQVRSTRTVRLYLEESPTMCQEVADLPASRTYERVGHISFAGRCEQQRGQPSCNGCRSLTLHRLHRHVQTVIQ
jgi:hypothetical protein